MDVDPISQLAKVNNWKNQIFAKLIRMGNMKYKLALEANILISSNLQLKHSRQTKIRAEETKIGGMIMSTIDSNSLWRLTHHEDYEATKTHSGLFIDMVKLFQLILKIHNPNSGSSGDIPYQLMLKTKQKEDQPLAAFAEQFCNDLTSINANGGVNG